MGSSPGNGHDGGWRRVAAARGIRADWGRWLDDGRSVDPYLVWAELTGFAGFGGRLDSDGVPVLVELKPRPGGYRLPPVPAAEADTAAVDPVFGCLRIPPVYRLRLGDEVRLRWNRFTARVSPEMLPAVMACSAVSRLQLGVPRLPPAAPRLVEPVVTLEPAGFDDRQDVPRVVTGFIDDGCAFANPAFCDGSTTRVQFLWDQNPRPLWKGSPWEDVVLPLDYGAEVWHDALAQASRRAVEQRDELAPYVGLDYGPTTLGLDERGTGFRPNGGLRAVPAQALRSAAHGTGVLALAVGRGVSPDAPHPLDAQRAVAEDAAAGGRPPARADHAHRWPVIFVQLPTRTTLDTSGGSLGVHVLDGLHYIIDRALRLPYDRVELGPSLGSERSALRPSPAGGDKVFIRNRVLVNISYGALAGPHDGTSILELALAEVARDLTLPELWLTLAAGNAHRTRTHAQLTLSAGESGFLSWFVAPDHPHESFLEIWLPDVDRESNHFAPGVPEVVLDITAPGATQAKRVRIGEGWLHDDPAQPAGPVAGVFYARRVAQGLRGTMVLLAVARTRRPPLGETEEGAPGGAWPVAPHGEWRIEVGFEAPAGAPQIDVHAWTERNDLLYGNLRAQQSRVVDDIAVPEPTEFTPEAQHLDRHPWRRRANDPADPMRPRYGFGSVAGLTGHRLVQVRGAVPPQVDEPRVLAAAAYRLADGELSAYSSGGPSRMSHDPAAPGRPPPAMQSLYESVSGQPRERPDYALPADIGPALPGLRVVGVRAGASGRLGGTSAAAPLLLRHQANQVWYALWKTFQGQHPQAVVPVAQPSAPELQPKPARPTPTPQADDRFRAGKRLR